MTLTLSILVFIVIGFLLIAFFAPRPRLNPEIPPCQVPQNLNPAELAQWLKDEEHKQPHLISGTQATVAWADKPEVTDFCLLYLHGFSASRQEIAPVTEKIATHFGANIVYARLAGHGLSEESMQASAEQWLQSTRDSWELAARLGKKVIIVATSNGAPLALWLHEKLAAPGKIHAMIYLSPNFKLNNPFGFLLTWPWAKSWVPKILGDERVWEPENDLVAQYWSYRYSVHAVIEVQKVVDWASTVKIGGQTTPLATLYMDGDPTISHEAAIKFHNNWPAVNKLLQPVDLDSENPQHVFAGAATAPHRTQWCVDTCVDFLENVEA